MNLEGQGRSEPEAKERRYDWISKDWVGNCYVCVDHYVEFHRIDASLGGVSTDLPHYKTLICDGKLCSPNSPLLGRRAEERLILGPM